MRLAHTACGLLCLLLPLSAAAQHRAALIVGSNAAPPGLHELRYAHDDARKLREVLVELGGLDPKAARLLLEPSAEELRAALTELRAGASPDAGHQTLLLYYSGHSDAEALQLGADRLPLTELHGFLQDERAAVRVALLDSCHSGAVSQTKGGIMRPGVDIRWATEPGVKGAVLVTSSTAEEASIERDDIGGSLFTHFFVSGLRGAADADGDGAVNLEEAFRYAHGHTLVRSAESRSGAQHPTFDYRISGQRQLVLTWLDVPSALRFGEELSGTYLVFDRARHQVVAELVKEPGAERRLALPAGDYYVKKRLPAAVLLQKVSLIDGEEVAISDHAMHTVPYEEDVTKGRLSQVFQPTWMYGAPFIANTAFTLRRGEVSLGLVTTSLGVSDDVTLSTYLLADLVAVPSIAGKFRLLQTDSLVWSLHTELIVALIGRLAMKTDRSHLWLETGSTLSWLMGPSLTLSLIGSWRVASGADQEDVEWEVQELIGGGSVTWSLGERDLIQLVGHGTSVVLAPAGATGVGDIEWGGRLLYAHAFGTFRAGLGVSRESDLTQALDVDSKWAPWLDLWWRW